MIVKKKTSFFFNKIFNTKFMCCLAFSVKIKHLVSNTYQGQNNVDLTSDILQNVVVKKKNYLCSPLI